MIKNKISIAFIIILLIVDLCLIIYLNIPNKNPEPNMQVKEISSNIYVSKFKYAYFEKNNFDNRVKDIYLACMKDTCYNFTFSTNYVERGAKIFVMNDNCKVSYQTFEEDKNYYLCGDKKL